MKLPLALARGLLLLQQTGRQPFSSIRHPMVNDLLHDGILQKSMQGRGRAFLALHAPQALTAYLANRFGIADLEQYIKAMESADTNRHTAVQVAANSKVKKTRSFTGFMVASLAPVAVMVGNRPYNILPGSGVFTYISDYKNFSIPGSCTVIGIENPHNFLQLAGQAYLFNPVEALFVCRYPYSSDLVKWLQQIPNPFLYFGDYDFAGIQIFLNEYWKYIPGRAHYFIPDGLEEMMARYGNRMLYDRQAPLQLSGDHPAVSHLQPLIDLIHRYKKGLEQEIFVR